MDMTYTFSSWNDKNNSAPFRDITKIIKKLNEDESINVCGISFEENSFKSMLKNYLVQEKLRDYPNSYEKFKNSTNVHSNASELFMDLAGIFNVSEVFLNKEEQSKESDQVYFYDSSKGLCSTIKETSTSRKDYYGEGR